VWVHSARHGDGAAIVLQAVVSFVLNGRISAFLAHVGLKTAALHHKVVDHSMEDGAVVVPVLSVLDEICNGGWRFIGIQLQRHIAEKRFH
jgi:hypothetical protein